MGTLPPTPGYEPGDECAACVNLLFDGVTPRYVEADVTGVIKCPGAPQEFRDGTFLLTQTVDPCRWTWSEGLWGMAWAFAPGVSGFSIIFPGFLWFRSSVNEDCYDAFVNQNVCGVGPVIGSQGYATLWWGPTIGP